MLVTEDEIRCWAVTGLTGEIVARDHKELFVEAEARAKAMVSTLSDRQIREICSLKIRSLCTYGMKPMGLLELIGEENKKGTYLERTKGQLFPECARHCDLMRLLGVSECESVCPEKFDKHGNPIETRGN